ncbi:DoxX family membrane protein [Candidatus Marinimicrobia bacterium]|nr:DoxX family membrane protein [Candidatus Neomarinimicrobiota bacterium]
MKSLLNNKKLLYVSRLILGIIFIGASFDKIIDPKSFSSLIDNYHVTPVLLNNLAALFIPWLELVVGICLIRGVYINGASFIVSSLLVFFIFILVQALVRGINLDCGCFSLSSSNLDESELKLNMLRRIFEDILFLGIAIFVNIGYNDK